MLKAKIVQEDQEWDADYKRFSVRVPTDIYDQVVEWEWGNRISLARACSILIEKGMTMECGERNIPESEDRCDGKESGQAR